MTLDTPVQPAAATTQIAPHFLARFNHVSPNFLPGFPLKEELDRYLQALPGLEAERETALKALYELIPTVQEESERRALVTLRRALFNRRPLRALTQDSGRRLPSEVLEYLQASEQSLRHKEQLEAAFEAHLSGEREGLRQVCRDERFLQAVAVSSTPLLDAARQYAATPLAEQRGSLRKSEHRLLQFAARAGWKTSPFSFYTSVCGGRWRPGGPERLARPAIQAAVQVNHVLVLRLLDHALRVPELRARLCYRLAPQLRVHGAEVQFEQALDDPARQPRARNLASRRVTFRLTGGLARILQVTSGHSLPYDDLLRALSGSAGALSAAGGPGQAAAHRFLGQLIDAGFLCPETGIAEQTPELLVEAAALLRQSDSAQARAAAASLTDLNALLCAFPAEAAARPATLARARHLMEAAYAALGAALPAGPVLYEDTASTDLLTLAPAAFGPAFEHLQRLTAVLRVFDTHLLFEPLVRARVRAQVGPGGRIDDLAGFVRDHADLFDVWLQASARGLPPELQDDPDLQAILRIQREVRGAYLEAARLGQSEIDFPAAQVQTWFAALPARLTRRNWSYGVFVQAAVGDPLQLHVNQIYAGSGQYFSRFLTQLHPGVQQDVQDTLRRLTPPKTLLVQLRSVHGFNANLHPAVTETELVVDEPATGPQLGAEDLYLEHDLTSDEVVIREKAGGRRIQVVYAGFLIAQLLPTLKNFLVTLTNNGLIVPHLPDIADRQLSARQPDTVRRTPRLRSGPVVLHRARWVVPRAAFPLLPSGSADGAFVLELQRWRHAHGLPERVFVRLRPARRSGAGAEGLQAWQSELSGGTQKPQLLDFSSPLHVRHLAKLARDSREDFVFEECTPLPETCLLRDDSRPLVSELLIEVQHTGGPR